LPESDTTSSTSTKDEQSPRSDGTVEEMGLS